MTSDEYRDGLEVEDADAPQPGPVMPAPWQRPTALVAVIGLLASLCLGYSGAQAFKDRPAVLAGGPGGSGASPAGGGAPGADAGGTASSVPSSGAGQAAGAAGSDLTGGSADGGSASSSGSGAAASAGGGSAAGAAFTPTAEAPLAPGPAFETADPCLEGDVTPPPTRTPGTTTPGTSPPATATPQTSPRSGSRPTTIAQRKSDVAPDPCEAGTPLASTPPVTTNAPVATPDPTANATPPATTTTPAPAPPASTPPVNPAPAPRRAPPKPEEPRLPLRDFPTDKAQFTVVLRTVDRRLKADRTDEADELAQRAARARLDVGILESNRFPNLFSDLAVVFVGAFDTEEEARKSFDELVADGKFVPESFVQILPPGSVFPPAAPEPPEPREPRRATRISSSR